MSCETGNIFIEIEYNKKASALMTTTADWWVVYDEKKYMMFTPKEIIRCIFINQLVHRHCIGRGDVKSKRGFLVEKKLLFQYGKEIK